MSNVVIQTVLPLFLIIGLGYAIGKYRKVDVKSFTDLLIYITCPCLVFTSLSKSAINQNVFLMIALATAGIIIIQAILAYFFLKVWRSEQRGLYLPLTMGNTGFMGYPVALFAFGSVGLSIAVIYDIIMSLFLYSAGIYIINREKGFKEVLKLPLIYAALLGIIFNFGSMAVYPPLFKSLEMIGLVTIPVALLILGYRLTEIKISSLRLALFSSAFKMGGGFVIAYFVLGIFSITGVARSVVLLQAAMPSAVVSLILATKYERDTAIVASVVMITTLMSLVTIPLILYLVG